MSKNHLPLQSILILCFALGIAGGHKLALNLLLISELVLVLIGFAILVFKKQKLVISCVLAFTLGSFYINLHAYSAPKQFSPGCNRAVISSQIKESGAYFEFLAKAGREATVIRTKTLNNYGYKDTVEFCISAQNAAVETSRADYYLSKYKTEKLIENPEIKILEKGHGIVRAIFDLSQKIESTAKELFIGDEAILAKGLIIGSSSGFSDKFKENLQRSGTSHIVAVSGYNVSIITVIIFQIIRNLFSRRSAIISSIVFLGGFCLLSGFTPSVTRASFMGATFILAKIIGRKGTAVNSLFVAGLVMLLVNPYALWDISFELSFAATAGLALSDEIMGFVKKKAILATLTTILAETLVAQVFTLPIILLYFGRVSLVAPLANILILPIIPLAMLLVSLSIAGFFVFKPFGIIVGGLTGVILNYITLVINALGSLKWSAYGFDKIHWGWTIAAYVLLIVASIFAREKIKEKRLQYIKNKCIDERRSAY